MSERTRIALFWLAAIAVFVAVLLVLRAMLLPFIASLVIAYALAPVVDWLEKRKINRSLAATFVILIVIVVFLVVTLALGPILIGQLAELANRLPNYIEEIQDLFGLAINSRLAEFLGLDAENIRSTVRQMLGSGGQIITTFVRSVWSGGQALASILSLMVITPFVTFYLLRDWKKMVAWIDDLLPREHVDEIHTVASAIDLKIAAFIRGQLLVGLVLGVFYATGLLIIGVNYGLLIGVVAGVISFVPYLGFAVGFVLSMVVAVVQFWPDWVMPAYAFGLFMVGQLIESYVLYPRIMGEQVGMHPVWLFFSLFAFGLLFGFVGVLIAIPAAAAVGVVMAHFINRYRASTLYSGQTDTEAGAGER